MSKFTAVRDFLTNHKRLFKIAACCFNALFVLALFLSSALLLYYVKSPAQTVFGYNGVLVKDDLKKTATFVFLDKKAAVPKASSEFLYVQNTGLLVCKITSYADNTITFLDNQTLSLTDPEYGGQILWKSDFIGKIVAPFSQKQNLPLVYLMIIGVSLLCLLSLTIAYIFTTKPKPDNEIAQIDEADQIEEVGQLEEVETIAEVEEIKAIIKIKDTEKSIPKKSALPINEPPQTIPIDNFDELDNFDDMPSIDSLMDEISKLSNEWDDDMKMYH